MRSIRTKLFVFMISLMSVYAVLGILLNLFFLKPYYMQQSQIYFKNAAIQLKELDASQNISKQISEIGHDTGMFLAITDRQFRILCSSNNLNEQLLPPDVISALVKAGKGQSQIYTVSDDDETIPKLIYMERLNEDRRIVLTKSISVIDESVSIANHFYIVTGLLVLVIGSVSVFIFSKTLTTPIIKISRTAQNIAELNFDETVEIQSKDELGSLAQSINKLSDNLKVSLDQLQKDISFQKTLSRNLSHELKTPVAVIKGHAEGLIYSVVNTPEDQRKYLDVIVNECDRMDHLVKEMLMLSKLSVYDTSETHFEKIDAAVLCSHVEARFSPIFLANGILFSTQNGEGFTIEGSPDLLEHAVSNYISNAVKYGAGKITLKFAKQPGKYIISVYNTGENIAPEELQHIFEPFYKLNYARSSKEEGHGLGLAIVQSVAVIHGGRAYAQNRENGVEFILEIPIR